MLAMTALQARSLAPLPTSVCFLPALFLQLLISLLPGGKTQSTPVRAQPPGGKSSVYFG